MRKLALISLDVMQDLSVLRSTHCRKMGLSHHSVSHFEEKSVPQQILKCYTKKYSHCQKLFDHRGGWRQYQKNWTSVKRKKYVGGFYTQFCCFSETTKMHLATGKHPFFLWFIMYNFKCMLFAYKHHSSEHLLKKQASTYKHKCLQQHVWP